MPGTQPGRAPAAPSSARQHERHARILQAARELGTELPFEAVQMQDVAAKAEVAIATLYRYFPTKAHLYVGVLRAYVEERMNEPFPAVLADATPAERVAEFLVQEIARMAQNPVLSLSMVQSIIPVDGALTRDGSEARDGFDRGLMAVAGWPAGDAEKQRRIWLMTQCYYGMVLTVLNGSRPQDQVDADLRLAAQLLLG